MWRPTWAGIAEGVSRPNDCAHASTVLAGHGLQGWLPKVAEADGELTTEWGRVFGATSEQQRPNSRENRASSGTRRRSQALLKATLYGLQNLHPRFKSGRRLHFSAQDREQQAIIAELRRRYVDGPVLIVPRAGSGSSNNMGATVIPGAGTVFRAMATKAHRDSSMRRAARWSRPMKRRYGCRRRSPSMGRR
jgi:hypothetical protein